MIFLPGLRVRAGGAGLLSISGGPTDFSRTWAGIMDAMQDAYAHCERLVRAADKDRYLATLFAPAELRSGLFALYAFDVELARVRELAREPLPSEIRLQWWSEVLRRERDGEANAHPVAAALLATLAQHSLAAAPLIDLVEARTFDIYDDPMATLADLGSYAERTSSAVIALAAEILGASGAGVARSAHHAGIAAAIAALLRAFPRHSERRQLYLPVELLQRHGVRADDVFAGVSSPGLNAALADLRGVARRHLVTLGEALPALPPQALPAFLPVALVGPALDRLAGSEPFAPRDIAPWRRPWLIWRAARRPSRIAG
jgi:phytoene synthase